MIDVGWLAETGPCKMFKSGQSIPCPGVSDTSERAMYILIVGRVDVYRAGESGAAELVGTLNPGDVFGGREFFCDITENVYATVADSVVYVLSESSFNDLSWAQPGILFEVLKAAYAPMEKSGAPGEEGDGDVPAAAEGPPPKGAQAQKEAAKSKAAAKQKQGAGPKEAVKPAPAPKQAAGADDKGKAPVKPDAGGLTQMTPAHNESLQTLIPGNIGIFPEGHKLYPGITRPEYKKLVYPKSYDCPFCKKQFMEYKVFQSKLYEAAPVRYDLRRFYTDFQTEWYDVITCPHCYFSMLHNYFTEPKPLQTAKIENELTAARAAVFLDFEAERDLDYVFTSHFLADLCAEGYRSYSKLIRSKVWGNLSWLYEDAENEEMMKTAAGKAAAAYESVYAETRLTPLQEQVTCLSIAGMQYRAGVDRDMKRYLFTAKTVKDGDKTYAKLAEDFLYELRDEA